MAKKEKVFEGTVDLTELAKELSKETSVQAVVLDKVESKGTWDTGLIQYDVAGGGVHWGKMVHIWGKTQTAKTALGLYLIRRFQDLFPVAVTLFGDTERSLEGVCPGSLPCLLGVDTSRVIRIVPETAEQLLEAFDIGMRKVAGKIGKCQCLAIWDTPAHTATKEDVDRGYKLPQPGSMGRLLSAALRLFRATVDETGSATFVMNQCRDKIGVKFGAKSGPPGGRALEHDCDQQYALRTICKLVAAGSKDPIGTEIEFKIQKNRMGPPFRTGKFRVYYLAGRVTDYDCVYDALKRYGLIDCKSGKEMEKVTGVEGAEGGVVLNGVVVGKTKAEFAENLEKDPALRDLVKNMLREKMFSPNVAVLEEKPDDKDDMVMEDED